jgi:hypothetical protein
VVAILNKVGEPAPVLGVLRDADVNLFAFWGYTHGARRAQLEHGKLLAFNRADSVATTLYSEL